MKKESKANDFLNEVWGLLGQEWFGFDSVINSAKQKQQQKKPHKHFHIHHLKFTVTS